MSNLIVSELIYENDALIAAHECERWMDKRSEHINDREQKKRNKKSYGYFKLWHYFPQLARLASFSLIFFY